MQAHQPTYAESITAEPETGDSSLRTAGRDISVLAPPPQSMYPPLGEGEHTRATNTNTRN
jgi:hypothetical protein